MEDNVKVSIIVAIYNIEQYLNRCIDSLLKQSYINIEIILIDDGSTDKSLEICKMYNDPRIKIYTKTNGGLSSTRNYGIEVATGKYCIFIDGDDYVENDMVEKTLLFRKGRDVVFTSYIRDHGNNKQYIKYPFMQHINDYRFIWKCMLGSYFTKKTGGRFCMSVWGNLYSLDFLKKNNIFFKSERTFVSEDLVFHTDILKFNPTVYYAELNSYHYVLNDYQSLTKVFKENRFECETNLYEYLLAKCLTEEEKYRCNRSYLERVDAIFKNNFLNKKFNKDEVTMLLNSDNVQNAINFFYKKRKDFKFKVRYFYMKNKCFFLMKIIYKIV